MPPAGKSFAHGIGNGRQRLRPAITVQQVTHFNCMGQNPYTEFRISPVRVSMLQSYHLRGLPEPGRGVCLDDQPGTQAWFELPACWKT